MEDRRYSNPALIGGPFRAAKQPSPTNIASKLLASLVAVVELLSHTRPRTVVAHEHGNRVSIDAYLLERPQHFPYAPIDFFDHIAVSPCTRMPFEPIGCADRNVRHVVGNVHKERLPRWATANESNCLFGVALRERLVRDRLLDLLETSVQRDAGRRIVVVRVRQSHEDVETVGSRIESGIGIEIAKMPF